MNDWKPSPSRQLTLRCCSILCLVVALLNLISRSDVLGGGEKPQKVVRVDRFRSEKKEVLMVGSDTCLQLPSLANEVVACGLWLALEVDSSNNSFKTNRIKRLTLPPRYLVHLVGPWLL